MTLDLREPRFGIQVLSGIDSTDMLVRMDCSVVYLHSDVLSTSLGTLLSVFKIGRNKLGHTNYAKGVGKLQHLNRIYCGELLHNAHNVSSLESHHTC